MIITKVEYGPIAGCVCNPVTNFYWGNAAAAVPLIFPKLLLNNAAAACAPQFVGYIQTVVV